MSSAREFQMIRCHDVVTKITKVTTISKVFVIFVSVVKKAVGPAPDLLISCLSGLVICTTS
jgi:hypothetical protein